MLTNGHVMMGYEDGQAHVPRLPLSARRGGGLSGRCLEVFDADNYWMATFRNDEDVTIYIAERTAKMKAGRAAYEAHCEEAAKNEPPEGKSACPRCGKFFGSVKQHRKTSTKCTEPAKESK